MLLNKNIMNAKNIIQLSMEFYSDSRPNLIGPKIKMQLHKILKSVPDNSASKSYFVCAGQYLYTNYIKDHLLLIFIILFVAILLLIRYFTYKKNKVDSNKQENVTENYDGLLNEVSIEQIKHIITSDQPTVNPTKSVDGQDREHVNYLPADMPIKLNGKDITYTKQIYDDPQKFENLNTPNYNYEAAHYSPRSYYNGTYNTYQNSVDTNIPNPIGLPVSFNTSTEKFVNYATSANNDNVDLYQSILDNKEYNMSSNFTTKASRSIDYPFAM